MANDDWKKELREVCTVLKEQEIDILKLRTTGVIDGKRQFLTLKDMDIEEIGEIISKNNLNPDFELGKFINKYRLAYNGTVGKLSEEERQFGEEFGIVEKRLGEKTTLFKSRKISQFHIDFINGILDKMLTGEINTTEARKLLEDASRENGEAIIRDGGSIRRIVQNLLKDRPADLEKYEKVVKSNTGRRSAYVGKFAKPALGYYHEKEAEFKDKIINESLPKILEGKVTFSELEKELKASHTTIDKIICEYYSQIGDSDGLEQYKEVKKNASMRKMEPIMQQARERRDEVEQYRVVSSAEFLALSPDEQTSQLIKKIRLEKLKEERSDKATRNALTTEETTEKMVAQTIKYFKDKNIEGNEAFSDADIKYMIYRYPTLISRSPDNLDEKFEVLTSHDDIDALTAYGMVKTAPTILGYDVMRTKRQLDLLEQNGIIDAAISRPTILMNSPALMHALIEYAKERNGTSDLTDIRRTNIFMSNSTLKRLYGVTSDELKARYPYEVQEHDQDYIISGKDLGKTRPHISKTLEADQVVSDAVKDLKRDKTKGVGEDGSI